MQKNKFGADGLFLRHATQRKYEYRHTWRPGDWVLWDNRSVMHQANPDYDMRERRRRIDPG